MKAEPHSIGRKGRWSSDSLINALERRYATIRGRYETIDKECEMVVGVTALTEAHIRIESDKKLMRRVLDAIEIVAQDVNPNWRPSRVKPIYPKRRDGSSGQIAKTAYRLLRTNKGPMTVRELAKAAVRAHGHEIEERIVSRFDGAIRRSLDSRIGSMVGVIQGSPKRYFILEPASSAE